jgi:hypothetical protein
LSISISTNHLLLDDQGLTLTARGYEISWLHGGLIIERLSDGHAWNWTKEHGRWTVMGNGDHRVWVGAGIGFSPTCVCAGLRVPPARAM